MKILKKIFKDPLYLTLAVSFSFNLLLLYYLVFLQSTTFSIFWQSNSPLYNILSLLLNILIGVTFGISLSLLIYQIKEAKKKELGSTSFSFTSAFLGAISTGCPVCGAYLMSILGIAGGLAAFPFQGLEIKGIALALLFLSIRNLAKNIEALEQENCQSCQKNNLSAKDNFKVEIKEGYLILTLPQKINNPLKYVGIPILAFLFIFYLPVIASSLNLKLNFQNQTSSLPNFVSSSSLPTLSEIASKVLPEEGYTINATYGDIGPKLLKAGAIDFEKFKAIYERAGAPLTPEQIEILTKGSNQKIKITRENAYFLLNLFWALGLTNKNPILEKGPLMKYGGKKSIGYFASTGGWTLGTKPATELYSSTEIIKLTPEQQKELEEFAYNSYRPCCNNSTAFADCNHGMAALALGEIMASQGATAEEIFEALKYFNAFWFPQQYVDLAKYFKLRYNQDWEEVDPKVVLGKDYSTVSGWTRVRNWLSQQGAIEQVGGGRGCGV